MFTTQHQTGDQSVWQIPEPGGEQRRRQHRLARLLSAVTVIVVAAGALAVVFTAKAEMGFGGCSVRTRPTRSVKFLIDQSDPCPEELLGFTEHEVRRLPKGSILATCSPCSFSAATIKDSPRPNSSAIAAGLTDAEEVNRLTKNLGRRDSFYVEQFEALLKVAPKRALEPIKAHLSPLLEALYTLPGVRPWRLMEAAVRWSFSAMPCGIRCWSPSPHAATASSNSHSTIRCTLGASTSTSSVPVSRCV